MHVKLVLQLLALLSVANVTPIFVKNVIGRRWALPLDGGLRLPDGQPLFGTSKTVRGILAAVLATAVVGSLIGLGWKIGAVVGAFAMAGDLFSSFLKRRMRLESGGRASGLDQVPESLFPLLACRGALELTLLDIGIVVLVFFLGEVVFSLLFFKLHLRERPY